MSHTLFKVVEVTTVTDEELEKQINKWTSEEWILDSIKFAMRDASKRPSMAFIIFTKSADIKH